MSAFVAIEPRIAIACAGIAVAIFLPAWGSMHHPGESFELGLTIAGCLAVLGTVFGTITVYEGEWNFQALFFYVPWIIFGAVSCAVLVIGISKSASLGWQVGLAVVAVLEFLMILLPVIMRRMESKRERK